jgi:putative spermidine/putrescine transport system substrate-binding protein
MAAGLAAAILPRVALAQSRPTLRVQSQGGLVEQTLRDAIIPEFEKLHGIDVQLIIEDDTTILPKLQVARSRAPYDVCTMDNDKAILGAGMGLWAPEQPGKLKNLGAVYKSCQPPATSNYASQVYEYPLVYNVQTFGAAPTSWQDLWRPGITVGVPHVSQGYGLTFLYIAAMLNGGSATNLEPGYAAIKRLEKIRIYRSVSQGLALFQQKEVDAALFYAHRAQQMIDAGLPVQRTVPKEGSWGMRTGAQIPKQTANMDGALLWVDTMLSVPYQTAFTKSLYSPTNRDVKVDAALASRLLFGEARVDAIREAPWADILPQRDAILDRWNREFGT